MAETMNKARVIGDYIVGRQIGSGSFSVVWHGRHRVHGTEVAVKEIIMERLNKKLHDSLMSEVVILKNINHPNIIRLHEIIEKPGRIYLILEYCKGGDLSLYIQRRGSVTEETAKYFMQQLASGLQVLRDNSIIHRDLKPQNLLLLTSDHLPILKIADFGFARSLQPLGLAETLCGSPLYMAPEIMQLQKYDAKADLWSVGAILFQLVTGKTPFTGNNQIQLLQNIMKSIELQFPLDKRSLSSDCLDLCQKLLRRNPVERLTFEEFFNHQFLSQNSMDELLRNRTVAQYNNSSALFASGQSHTHNISQDECLPFVLDSDSNITKEGSDSRSKKTLITPTYGFSINTEVQGHISGTPDGARVASMFNMKTAVTADETHVLGCEFPLGTTSKGVTEEPIKDSLECIVQEYVIVSGPPVEGSSSSLSGSLPFYTSKSQSSPAPSANNFRGLSAPVPIRSAAMHNPYGFGSISSNNSLPSGASPGSVGTGDNAEQPSDDFVTRIRSLQQCAHVIADLVKERFQVESGRRLEALSIQLVILAVWKQALLICQAQGEALKRSLSQEPVTSQVSVNQTLNLGCQESLESQAYRGNATLYSKIEREFLLEVSRAEELAEDIGPDDGNMEMPDAMEVIFQAALALGRHGAVDELMGDMEHAGNLYSKAVCLLLFLLVEAPSLIINPPFFLSPSDRSRLRSYINILNNRQSHSMSQRMVLLRSENQQASSP